MKKREGGRRREIRGEIQRKKRGEQSGRRLTGLPPTQLNDVLICVFKLCDWVPTVFYVHTPPRGTIYRMFRLWFYNSPHFQINFPGLCWNISWFMGAMKVKNGQRAEPLSLVPDQNPFRSKRLAHSSLRDSLVSSLPVNIKVLVLPGAKPHWSIYICCFFVYELYDNKKLQLCNVYEILKCCLTASVHPGNPEHQLHLLRISFFSLDFSACLSIVWCYFQLPLNSLTLWSPDLTWLESPVG